ncbi:hypothetical protein NDU88_011664 [Pleurodeles waltl]|uniref:Uncharacterized protein n=1 Tax=Pleurodeles waltl TaxID=8319 RepID=A0AAV7Q2B5_PLEWA|nr:hypothetical protein NDU88_011664 [Pleurodeles waltl]
MCWGDTPINAPRERLSHTVAVTWGVGGWAERDPADPWGDEYLVGAPGSGNHPLNPFERGGACRNRLVKDEGRRRPCSRRRRRARQGRPGSYWDRTVMTAEA